MRKGLVMLLVGVASCKSANADVEKGPVILQCDGDRTATIFTTARSAHRYTFRVDGHAKTFEEWNEAKRNFEVSWKGRLEITPAKIAFVGAGGSADGAYKSTRKLEIDRLSGNAVEQIVGTVGVWEYTGNCKQVSAPESDRRF